MIEVEMAAARHVYELQAKRSPVESLARWFRSVGAGRAWESHRARKYKKAEVGCKAKRAL
jgi:hypothetical protein